MPKTEAELAQDYDPISSAYGDYVTGDVTKHTIADPGLLKQLGDVSGKDILDYGCGVGQMSLKLCKMRANVVAADKSKVMVEAARLSLPSTVEVHHVEKGVCPPTWGDRFDAAITCFVLCVMMSDEIKATVRSILHCLKPGGILLVLNTNWDKCNGHEFASFRLDHIDDLVSGCQIGLELKGPKPVRLVDYFWSQEDYCGFLREVGFETAVSIELPASEPRDARWIDEEKAPPFYIIKGVK